MFLKFSFWYIILFFVSVRNRSSVGCFLSMVTSNDLWNLFCIFSWKRIIFKNLLITTAILVNSDSNKEVVNYRFPLEKSCRYSSEQKEIRYRSRRKYKRWVVSKEDTWLSFGSRQVAGRPPSLRLSLSGGSRETTCWFGRGAPSRIIHVVRWMTVGGGVSSVLEKRWLIVRGGGRGFSRIGRRDLATPARHRRRPTVKLTFEFASPSYAS